MVCYLFIIDPADDPIVLCYISVGEDSRTTETTDEEFASDPRFRGNGQGPRVDPRGKYMRAHTNTLAYAR